ncbi:hypothetical protein EV189_3462 [Motilibacter rhizosphaerae]|uniref:Dienelactone hydrolase n=1 Tax=Motilibacter rhizosphaerae TaxID=598652 RepID=A0A4Q7NAW6_9ACTN|nr:alpha/beta hydrolase [Motilibacter rhizosphaerae]RZS79983.1 hypothetical protein EV189_3462 [Motilibacter rhizosphaerae]
MDSLLLTSSTTTDGVTERRFHLGDVPGILWTPEGATGPRPLVLLGHGGGMRMDVPRLVASARATVSAHGFAVAAIDAPGHGARPRLPRDDAARAEIRAARTADDSARFAAVSTRYMAELAEQAVPEWQAVIDALQALPEVGADAPVGYGGSISLGSAIGIPLTAAEPRIRAAVFGGGFFVSAAVVEAARRIRVPVQFLLPWDDEHASRADSLALFDAFGSEEKTLHANPGDHRRPRWLGLDEDFLARHLTAVAA